MSWNPDESLEESDEEEESVGAKGREAYIFVVDALLFRSYEHFEECLAIIRDALLNGVLTRGKDLIGMVLANTEHSPPPKDSTGMENIVPHKNTAVFIPLRPLSKEAVQYYLNFQSPDHFDFENKYGCQEGSFANTMWLCTNMFQQCGYKLSLPAIIYFTDRTSPHEVNSPEFQQAMRKAKDLNEIGVDFTVCPMSDQFDYNLFYREFFCTVTDTDLDSYNPDDPRRVRAVIANRMIRRNFQTHCNAYVRWKISDDLNIAVGIYNFYKRHVYPKPVTLFREDNSLIETKRSYKILSMDDCEARICLPNEQRKSIIMCGEKIHFSNEELHHMKTPMGPGIQLLGFKPRGTLKQENFLKSADFLYPNEKFLVGSTKLFRALWEKCLEKNKIAFCVLVARRNASPQYVALIPVKNENNESNINGICNEGFHIWYFPTHSDIRKLHFADRPVYEDSAEELDLMTKIVKKLRIKYSPESFKDPALSAIRANIVEVAFDIEAQDPIDLNSLECMGIDEERLNNIIQSFKDDLQLIQSDPVPENIPQKRKAGASQSQKTKVTRAESAISKEDIERLIANDTLGTLTVKDLREYLRTNNIAGISSATKPALISKVLSLHAQE